MNKKIWQILTVIICVAIVVVPVTGTMNVSATQSKEENVRQINQYMSFVITKPKDHLYLANREIMPLQEGSTIVIGPITIQIESVWSEVGVVIFIDGVVLAYVLEYSGNGYEWPWLDPAFFWHTIKAELNYPPPLDPPSDEVVVFKLF